MWPLASAFLDIALHRRGPEDLPASSFLVALLFPVYLLSGLAVIWIDSGSTSANVLIGIIEPCALVAFIWIVLVFAGKPARFRQTASAVLGTGIWLNLLAMPLQAWHDAVRTGEEDMTFALFLLIVLVLWSVDISGYILSRALSQPYMVGVLIVVLYFMTTLSIVSALPSS